MPQENEKTLVQKMQEAGLQQDPVVAPALTLAQVAADWFGDIREEEREVSDDSKK